jgi:predicted amidophosphoribosyltransferase
MNTKPCPSCGEEIDEDCDICEDCAMEIDDTEEDEEEEYDE